MEKIMSQGSNANLNGDILNATVKTILFKNGINCIKYKDYIKKNDINNVAILNKPFKDIYGLNKRAQFVIKSSKLKRDMYITGAWQQVSGTAQEKLLYMFENIKIAPEKDAIFILDGKGFKKEAVNWFISKARSFKGKNINVFSINEFATWANKELRIEES